IFTAPVTPSIFRLRGCLPGGACSLARIALRKRQWDRSLLGPRTGANISYFLPKRYTVRAGTRKSPG
ncbi:MAG: hypothetical protein WBW81_16430, partial [Methylocella sp.]